MSRTVVRSLSPGVSDFDAGESPDRIVVKTSLIYTTGAVLSVHGKQGAVILTPADIGALPSNDPSVTDTRTPTDGSVTDIKVAAGAAIAESKLSLASDAVAATPSRRTLGTGAQQAAAGNDARFSDARPPSGAAGGDLTGTYPNPTIGANKVTLAQMAAMGTARFLGRNSAAVGNVEELTAAQAKTILALVKADVGLGNVDNTTDVAKPVSTAQQSALDLKAPLASPTFTGVVTVPDASFVIAKLSATGTPGATTYLRGDGSWAVPDAGVPGAHAASHASGGTDAVSLAASQITSGQFAMARLASGVADGTKYIRDDGVLSVPSGGGTVTSVAGVTPTTGDVVRASLITALKGTASTDLAAGDITAANGKGFVNHGSTAGTARPAGYASIEWFGTVEPVNAINGDTWNDPT